MPSVRDSLREAVTSAMRRRDRTAVAAYRTALGALDNAGARPAVDAGPLPTVGLGATEAPRRSLTEDEMVAVVRAEAASCRAGADATPDPDRAEQLRRQADLLAAVVAG